MASYVVSRALRVVTGIVLWLGFILSSFSLFYTYFLYGEMMQVVVRSSTKRSILLLITNLVFMTLVPCILGLIGFHKSKPKYLGCGVFISRFSLAYWMLFVIILDVTWILREDLVRNWMTEPLSEYEYFAPRLYGQETRDIDLLLLKAICYINIFTFFLVCTIWSSTSIIYRYYKKLEKKLTLRNPLFDIETNGRKPVFD